MARRWYVTRTEPRAEFLASSQLLRDGYEIFFPRIKDPYPRVGHTDGPLFPGYIFLRCDPEAEGWPSFRPGHRIAGWVSFGGEVPWLPDEVVAQLKAQSEMINVQGGLWQRFQRGETVVVVTSSMEQLAEVVEEAKSPQARTKVLLEFMGRLVQAQIPWQNLRSLDDSYRDRHRPPRRTRGQGRWIRGFGTRELARA